MRIVELQNKVGFIGQNFVVPVHVFFNEQEAEGIVDVRDVLVSVSLSRNGTNIPTLFKLVELRPFGGDDRENFLYGMWTEPEFGGERSFKAKVEFRFDRDDSEVKLPDDQGFAWISPDDRLSGKNSFLTPDYEIEYQVRVDVYSFGNLFAKAHKTNYLEFQYTLEDPPQGDPPVDPPQGDPPVDPPEGDPRHLLDWVLYGREAFEERYVDQQTGTIVSLQSSLSNIKNVFSNPMSGLVKRNTLGAGKVIPGKETTEYPKEIIDEKYPQQLIEKKHGTRIYIAKDRLFDLPYPLNAPKISHVVTPFSRLSMLEMAPPAILEDMLVLPDSTVDIYNIGAERFYSYLAGIGLNRLPEDYVLVIENINSNEDDNKIILRKMKGENPADFNNLLIPPGEFAVRGDGFLLAMNLANTWSNYFIVKEAIVYFAPSVQAAEESSIGCDDLHNGYGGDNGDVLLEKILKGYPSEFINGHPGIGGPDDGRGRFAFGGYPGKETIYWDDPASQLAGRNSNKTPPDFELERPTGYTDSVNEICIDSGIQTFATQMMPGRKRYILVVKDMVVKSHVWPGFVELFESYTIGSNEYTAKQNILEKIDVVYNSERTRSVDSKDIEGSEEEEVQGA